MPDLDSLAADRILVLDGAMGTMLINQGFSGSLDRLVLTHPEAVTRVHRAYLAAGSDIITTNTFTSTEYEINLTAARLARSACDEWANRTTDKPRFVAGAIGPMSRGDQYREQVRGLLDGGCDVLLIETATGSTTTLEALDAIDEVAPSHGRQPPVMISAAISTRTGRLFSGETIDDFWRAVAGAQPWSIGFNCGTGASDLVPHVRALARFVTCLVSVHPSAGLPDATGHYGERPKDLAAVISQLALGDLLNIVGGCCGTTPDHIAAVANAVAHMRPRSA